MAMRRLIALLVLLPALLAAQRTFTELDTAASQCDSTEALACSGGTLASTSSSALIDEGGTAGSTADSVQISDNTQRVIYWFESDQIGSGSTWPSGTFTVRVNITSADSDGQWDHTHVCRVSSTCGSPSAVGNLTNQNTALSTTGVKTHSVSGSSQTPNATDLILIVLTFEDTAAHGNMSVDITPNQDIDTPLTAPAGKRRVMTMSVGGGG
jgi:hypothetical protein